MNFFSESLRHRREEGLLQSLVTLEGTPGKYVQRAGKTCLNLSSNNYLGLAGHPRLKQAASAAALTLGTGAGGSRLLGGSQPLHEELEEALGRYRPVGKALIFNSGYMANLGILQALDPAFGVIFSDKSNHASMADGLLLSHTPYHRYRHCDMNQLENLLVKHVRGNGKQALVCSETLFSMDGDFIPLDDLLSLQKKYGFFLYLDEAHSTGCCPDLLSGLLASPPEKLLIMGTFGKAFGSFGAYVAGRSEVVDYLINVTRSFIFSTALPPAVTAANLAALKTAVEEGWRAEKLARLAEFARRHFQSRGLDTGSSRSHILPVLLGSNAKAISVSNLLYEAGIHAPPVRHPAVPKGTARLRINLNCDMEEKDILHVADVIADAIAAASKGSDE